MRALYLAALAITSVATAQSIPFRELLGRNNLLKDPLYGVSVTYPARWEVRSAVRWGYRNEENTITFQAHGTQNAVPRFYYAPYPKKVPADKLKEHLKEESLRKVEQRIREGLKDYANVPSSFDFTPINGRPAMKYVAVFTHRGAEYVEHITYVGGEKILVMFFLKSPINELYLVQRDFDRMIATVHVP